MAPGSGRKIVLPGPVGGLGGGEREVGRPAKERRKFRRTLDRDIFSNSFLILFYFLKVSRAAEASNLLVDEELPGMPTSGLGPRHRLPAVYPFRLFVAAGGLISSSRNLIDPYRQAAGYVDRILRGEKPADLPVQGATKFELVINLKTAKTLGLTVPTSLLSRANEVID